MLASIGRFILDYIASKVISLISALWAKIKRQKEVKDDSAASVDPLKKAVTGEEIDKATDGALDGF